jgi:cyclopropane fatty-acyl-phospholipid synthase-like methyltransferase
MNGGYDDGYEACPCFWGRDPGSLVARLSELIPSFDGMAVLDAGCGEGKNAAFLAQRGAVVDALELSDRALANARAAWPSAAVTWIHADVRDWPLRDAFYNLVIAYGLLHCLRGEDEVASVVTRLQAATRPGGWNIVCAFNSRRQELAAHPGFTPTLLTHQRLVDFYAGWSLAECSDLNLQETHPNNNIPHVHSMTRILARKT